MPHAAPGVIARRALRRTIPGEPYAPVQPSGRLMERYTSQSGSRIHFQPDERRIRKRICFTLHLSGFGVECGRLGEVESLVGDCRPPPPGNPHQPTTQSNKDPMWAGWRKNPFNSNGFITFIPKWQKNGGVFLPMRKHHSFNKSENIHNLKILNQSQYFKNNCSYFSCTEMCTVLEFVNPHCHLYGDWLVGPPSIAITNVLET